MILIFGLTEGKIRIINFFNNQVKHHFNFINQTLVGLCFGNV